MASHCAITTVTNIQLQMTASMFNILYLVVCVDVTG